MTLQATGEVIPHAFIATLFQGSWKNRATGKRIKVSEQPESPGEDWALVGAQRHPGVYVRTGNHASR